MKNIRITCMLFACFILFSCIRIDEDKAFVRERCTKCHSVKRTYKKNRSREEWMGVVDRMVRHGADLSGHERGGIVILLVVINSLASLLSSKKGGLPRP